ncbi:hypothetical protein ACLOJK_009210 [Asimina triloba]
MTMMEEQAKAAIEHALRALRKRHRLEEGAHGPAYAALSRPIASQGCTFVTHDISFATSHSGLLQLRFPWRIAAWNCLCSIEDVAEAMAIFQILKIFVFVYFCASVD